MTRVAAIVLAAGASERYRAAGGRFPSKVVALYRGEPMVRRAARAALEAGCAPVVVVTGQASAVVEEALAGLAVVIVPNAEAASGLASSLRSGLETLDEEVGAAVVVLGDMPLVEAGIVRALIDAATACPEAQAVAPVAGGRRGNPVLLARHLFPAAAALTGDEGARRLLRDPALKVLEIAADERAVSVDIDTPGDGVL